MFAQFSAYWNVPIFFFKFLENIWKMQQNGRGIFGRMARPIEKKRPTSFSRGLMACDEGFNRN